jgi:hypothetical protein
MYSVQTTDVLGEYKAWKLIEMPVSARRSAHLWTLKTAPNVGGDDVVVLRRLRIPRLPLYCKRGAACIVMPFAHDFAQTRSSGCLDIIPEATYVMIVKMPLILMTVH